MQSGEYFYHYVLLPASLAALTAHERKRKFDVGIDMEMTIDDKLVNRVSTNFYQCVGDSEQR